MLGAKQRLYATLALALSATQVCAQAAIDLKNWFDDPFFQVSAGIPDCPLPLGPLRTEEQRKTQAHSRAEKGTTCWLAGQCERPNDYAYDQDIAAAFEVQAASSPALFQRTSLWITVQGRVVFVEGCVSERATAAEIEAFARSLPYVKQGIALVRTSIGEPTPYKVSPANQGAYQAKPNSSVKRTPKGAVDPER